MDSLIIRGDKPLFGKVKVSGAKNAALPIMAASLLSSGTLNLTNIPKLTDINTMKLLLENHGARIGVIEQGDELNLSIDCSNINNFLAPYEIVRKMRAGVWVLAPLLARFGEAAVSLPGGCAIGARQVNLHIAVLEAMGAKIKINHGYINAKAKSGLQGVHFIFDKVSVGATITGILAGSLANGKTTLVNCAREPEIVDLVCCLKKMGAEVEGVGTSEITIYGKTTLEGATHRIVADRIEAGTYMIAAALTKGKLDILGIDHHIIENLTSKLIAAGMKVTHNNDIITIEYIGDLNSVDIQTESYPGFATDLQAQFMTLMSISSGTSVITENIFENRFMHVLELCRMGANITVNGNNAVVRGVQSLSGAEVMASDLRASSSLVLAGLAARGVTKIRRVYHLDRGYQLLEQKLTDCGAEIVRIRNES
jgi:UDP-N-acetylglucosamine 1-carboxyvinyltransferase